MEERRFGRLNFIEEFRILSKQQTERHASGSPMNRS